VNLTSDRFDESSFAVATGTACNDCSVTTGFLDRGFVKIKVELICDRLELNHELVMILATQTLQVLSFRTFWTTLLTSTDHTTSYLLKRATALAPSFNLSVTSNVVRYDRHVRVNLCYVFIE
jgi:hypothetical protein